LYRCSGLTPYELKKLHSSYKENRSETRFELWEFLFLILNIMENYYCKKPCKNCPFRNDVKPYLTNEFAEELAYSTQNPYNSFSCHKTTEYDEDTEDMEVTKYSKECAGFITMQIIENWEHITPEGFKPNYDIVYDGVWDMINAYEEREVNNG